MRVRIPLSAPIYLKRVCISVYVEVSEIERVNYGKKDKEGSSYWKHPKISVYDVFLRKYVEKEYQPMYDRSYIEVISEWFENHRLWERGEHSDQKNDSDASKYRYYAQWTQDPPAVAFYRPDWDVDKATWFQVYETISEGTPVTPAFATREELVDYLVKNGDYIDQQRRCEDPERSLRYIWSREQAESFVFGHDLEEE